MRVADVMQSEVVTVSPETSVLAVERLMRQHGVRHVPVVAGGKLLGVVSARDLARAQASPATSLARHELHYLLDRLTVEEIMSRPVIVVEPSLALDEAVRLMLVEGIRALPVTEAGRLVGVLTDADVLDLFLTSTRAAEPSSRLDVALGDQPGALADLVRAIAAAGARITNLVTLRTRDGRRCAIARIAAIDPRPAIASLRAAGYDLGEPWGAGHAEPPVGSDAGRPAARAAGLEDPRRLRPAGNGDGRRQPAATGPRSVT
jgi:acetoin utilization protein AcuB